MKKTNALVSPCLGLEFAEVMKDYFWGPLIDLGLVFRVRSDNSRVQRNLVVLRTDPCWNTLLIL